MRDGLSDFRLTANRLPVERFANCLSRIVSVWVYWTTCRVQISFQPDLHTWARHQVKKLERVLCTNWLARARKGHDIQRKQWQRQTIIAVKKQANKITEGLRTFQRCFLEKQINDNAVTLQILFLRGIYNKENTHGLDSDHQGHRKDICIWRYCLCYSRMCHCWHRDSLNRGPNLENVW